MLFVGQFDYAIDAQGRFPCPSEIQRGLNPDTDGAGFYAVPGPKGGVMLIPEKQFEALASRLPNDLRADSRMLDYLRLTFSRTERAGFDSAGRLRLSDRMLERVGISKKSRVMLVGCGFHLELYELSDWQAREKDLEARSREIQDSVAIDLFGGTAN